MLSSLFNTDCRAVLAALSASQAMIEFLPTGEILRANENFLTTLGYRLDEVVGRNHSLFCDPTYVQSTDYQTFWRALRAGQFQSQEFKRFGKGGRVIWLQATYNPIRDRRGQVIKVVKFASDITAAKRKAIDDAGKISAIYLSQAVIEFTPDGTVIAANDNFLKAMGYALTEIVGKSHRMFCDEDFVQSPDYTALWRKLANGEFVAAEYRRLGKNRREVFIQAAYNPIFDDTGQVTKIVKFAVDMTSQVQQRVRNDGISHEINTELGGVIHQILDAGKMANGASRASSETGAIINSVAAASEELSYSIREIAGSMATARESVQNIVQFAESANSAAAGLNDSAVSMNSVVGLIQDIASQINLLALNATIESARAGEAGKGFAVVASEVKSLANQAAHSTKTIGDEISKMQSVSTDVVQALALISRNITGVLENVSVVATSVDQQNTVTGEISSNMQTAVSAVEQIEKSLGHISSTFNQVSDASELVKQRVETLVA
jgi:methyl-accepting chemotaxis protein